MYGWGRLWVPPGVTGGLSRIGWSGLAGFAVAYVVGAAFHFWMPLKVVAPVFVALGVAAAAVPLLRELSSRKWMIPAGLLLVCVAFSSRVLIHGDTGSYHLQAVQWITEEHAVTGLANLHGRFGFNSAWWIVTGMMQMPWMQSCACLYLATGALAFFFGLLVIDGLQRLWAGAADAPGIIFSCATYLWFRQLAGINNPSIGTDAPANLLGVATAACLVMACRNRSPGWAGTCLLLATLAVTVKLSAAVWLPGALLAAALVCLLRTTATTGRLTPLAAATGLSGILAGLWMTRGYQCSGYPGYPSRLLGMPSLPWSVPPADMVRDTAGVRDWPTRGGTISDSTLDVTWRWVQNQYGTTNLVFAVMVALACLAAFVFIIPAARKTGLKALLGKIDFLVIPVTTALAGLAFCLLAAPAMRFASGYFFALIGMAFVAVFLLFPNAASAWWRSLALLLVISAVALNCAGVVARPPALLALPEFPPPQVEEKTTIQGIAIQVALPNAMAWNVRRPSTPYFDPGFHFEFTESGNVKMISKSPREKSSE